MGSYEIHACLLGWMFYNSEDLGSVIIVVFVATSFTDMFVNTIPDSNKKFLLLFHKTLARLVHCVSPGV